LTVTPTPTLTPPNRMHLSRLTLRPDGVRKPTYRLGQGRMGVVSPARVDRQTYSHQCENQVCWCISRLSEICARGRCLRPLYDVTHRSKAKPMFSCKSSSCLTFNKHVLIKPIVRLINEVQLENLEQHAKSFGFDDVTMRGHTCIAARDQHDTRTFNTRQTCFLWFKNCLSGIANKLYKIGQHNVNCDECQWARQKLRRDIIGIKRATNSQTVPGFAFWENSHAPQTHFAFPKPPLPPTQSRACDNEFWIAKSGFGVVYNIELSERGSRSLFCQCMLREMVSNVMSSLRHCWNLNV
jgi:hypothetical protein